MKHGYCLLAVTSLILCLTACNTRPNPIANQAPIRNEIEKILAIQEDAYDQNNEDGRMKLKATCDDSLVFVGGDDGGIATSSDFYVHDLADGYSERPHDRVFRIYDNTAIVSALQKTFKIFNKDTIFFNTRSTKVFVKNDNTWKMAYVTYAPLPVLYTKIQSFDENRLRDYTGLYHEADGRVDSVSLKDGKLILTAAGAPPAELKPVNDSTFIGDGYFGKTVFARNKKGVVTHNYFEFPDGQRLIFPKVR